jgi:hypothetical protein
VKKTRECLATKKLSVTYCGAAVEEFDPEFPAYDIGKSVSMTENC